jgi:ADP-ribose pyrophosphatase YjhB (NUDIX family)
MRPGSQFSVEYIHQGGELFERTFVPLAFPPRHDLVKSVYGWVFHGDELLLVRSQEQGWSLPGGARRPGETLRDTLERIAWESAGALVGQARPVGIVTSSGRWHAPDEPARGQQAWLVSSTAQLVPFSEHFDAVERLLIEPALIRAYIKDWTPLMDEMLAFALAGRAPSSVASEEDLASAA